MDEPVATATRRRLVNAETQHLFIEIIGLEGQGKLSQVSERGCSVISYSL